MGGHFDQLCFERLAKASGLILNVWKEFRCAPRVFLDGSTEFRHFERPDGQAASLELWAASRTNVRSSFVVDSRS